MNTATADRFFFGGMGLALAVTAFAGFAPTFFLRNPAAPALAPLLNWHGIITSAWMLLFMAQSGLIAARRLRLHRILGIAGAGLAMTLAVMAMLVSIASRGFTGRLVFAAGAVIMFLVYVGVGLAQRGNPAAHKRLMLLATISLIAPAISRLRLPFVAHDSFGPNFAALIFLLPAFVYDMAAHRKVHPALLWGGLFMVAMLPLRLLLKSWLS